MNRNVVRLVGALVAAAVMPAVALAQQATITGSVRNELGEPLRYATVAVERMNAGAQTNEAGVYTIVVPGARAEGQSVTLTARLVGYKPQSMTFVLASGTVTKDFRLEKNPLLLGEVVVTGSGTTNVREKLASDISSVKSEDIKKSNEVNIVNSLAAKAPGVEVTSQAGDQGAGSQIVIRGVKTLQGSAQPLFIVDGVPIDNSSTFTSTTGDIGTVTTNRAADINPNDVESIEVLKGAAASMLYGQRASAGVILITTKAGRAGETRYTLSSNTSFDEVNRPVPLQTSFCRGNKGTNAGPECGGPAYGLNALPQSRSWGTAIPAGTPTYDHFGELFRTGSTYDNSLSISGGDARRTFFLSAGATNQNGIIIGPNNEYNRYTVRLKATQQLTDELRIGGNVSYSDVRARYTQRGNNLNSLLLGATRTPAEYNSANYFDPVTGAQISYRRPRPLDATQDPVYDNPFWVVNRASNTSNVGRTVGNMLVDYQPLNWLKVNYTLGADYYADDRVSSLPPGSAGDGLVGQLYQGNYSNLIIDHNLLVTAQKDLGSNVQVRASLGQNLNLRRFKILQVVGSGYADPTLLTLNNTIPSNLQPQNYESKINIAGYFGQVEADLWNQVFLSAAVRADQASTYAPDKRTNYFPKVSAVWNVSNTMGNTSQRGMLSFLKLRGAYGQVGREPGAYQTLTLYGNGGGAFAYGGGLTTATQNGQSGLYAGSTLGFTGLGPEITAETEFGADFGLFNQRIDGSITYYDAQTTDVILSLPLPGSTGFSAINKNGAKIQNQGIELNLNGRVMERTNFRWEMGVNFTRNRNLVKDVLGAEFVGIAGGFGASAAVANQPLGVFYQTDFVRCGYSNNIQPGSGVPNDDINAFCASKGAPNGALFIGKDGFPIADPQNRVTGDPNANYLLGLRNNITLFKKLNLSALVDVRNGAQNWNGTRGALQSFGKHLSTTPRATYNAGTGLYTGNVRTFGVDFFPGSTVYCGTVCGGPATQPSVSVGQNWWRDGIGGGVFAGPGGQLVDNGAFTRIREISAAYTFDQPWVKKSLGLSSIDVRVSGRNLKVWTDYDGVDPETNLYGGTGIGRGIDYFNNPQSRSWAINFTLNR
ncbi:MAG: SusC/RagA family TonB-linked outer membrane protein [Gemmatimonadetes bacterium]|nr:SusC/RagA family TonB-linked outer membrane protein [Gemmatimonadota bacterium]